MIDLVLILVFCLVALVAAWLVNLLVGLLMGEHPKDTGRVWWEMLLRMFGMCELGVLGRLLNYANGSWPRRILTTAGAIVLLSLVLQACQRD